jgi:DNA-binding NarL/FixJ family response regulator
VIATSSAVRVVLAGCNSPIRSRIRDILQAGGCEVCADGATAAEAITLVLEHRPDVALLDVRLPGNGIHAARQISRGAPDTAIVMLTQSKNEDDLFDSLRAGASGYLLEDGDLHALPDALRGVLAGEAAMPPALVMRVLEEFRGPAPRRHMRNSRAAAKLSAREWEVMDMLSQGHSTRDVGTRLFLSPTTVRVHVSSSLRKLAVADRMSAFRLLQGD